MFEFICEHIFPGCTHRDKDSSEDELIHRAEIHLREHHNLDRHDDRIGEALKHTGMPFIHPA